MPPAGMAGSESRSPCRIVRSAAYALAQNDAMVLVTVDPMAHSAAIVVANTSRRVREGPETALAAATMPTSETATPSAPAMAVRLPTPGRREHEVVVQQERCVAENQEPHARRRQRRRPPNMSRRCGHGQRLIKLHEHEPPVASPVKVTAALQWCVRARQNTCGSPSPYWR